MGEVPQQEHFIQGCHRFSPLRCNAQTAHLLLHRAPWHRVLLVSVELCHDRVRNGSKRMEMRIQRLDGLAGVIPRHLPVHKCLLLVASGGVKDLPEKGFWGFLHNPPHAVRHMRGVMPSPGSCRVPEANA
jgi:hypothetical protein